MKNLYFVFPEALSEGSTPSQALQLGYELALRERDAVMRESARAREEGARVREERDHALRQMEDVRRQRDQALSLVKVNGKVNNRWVKVVCVCDVWN